MQIRTVSAGFHFAKKKPEKCVFQIWRKKYRTKRKPKKLTSEQLYFYKLKEVRSTSFLKIEAEYNQRDAKSVELLLQNSSNGTKIYFQKLLKVQDQAQYLKYIFLLI